MQCSVEFDRGLTAKESCDEIQSLPSQCWNLREEKVVYLVNNSLNYWCSRVLICRLLRNRWAAPTQFRVIFKGDESRSTWFIPAISKRERSSFKNGHVDFLSDFFFIALVDRQRWNEGAPVDRFKAARANQQLAILASNVIDSARRAGLICCLDNVLSDVKPPTRSYVSPLHIRQVNHWRQHLENIRKIHLVEHLMPPFPVVFPNFTR